MHIAQSAAFRMLYLAMTAVMSHLSIATKKIENKKIIPNVSSENINLNRKILIS